MSIMRESELAGMPKTSEAVAHTLKVIRNYAKLFGIGLTTLYRKMAEYGIDG